MLQSDNITSFAAIFFMYEDLEIFLFEDHCDTLRSNISLEIFIFEDHCGTLRSNINLEIFIFEDHYTVL